MAERTDKDWVEIIKKARKHPLGVKDYLEKQGINSKSYYKRFHRLRKTHPEWMPLSGRKGIRRGQKKSNANDPSTTFVPLQLTNKANLDSKTLSSDPSSIVEIVLSNDVVLRVNSNCSPDFAVRLAHAFGAR